MESGGGGASGGGGGGDAGACGGGHLCHACGYRYASAHPSAKQRRAHRKNCVSKPSPSAAVAEEDDEGAGSGLRDGGKLLLEQPSPDDAGVEVIINRSTEDIPSEVAPKANEAKIQTEAATQLPESVSYPEDPHPSQPAISFEQHLDASTFYGSLEPEYGASFSPESSTDKINKLNVMSLAPNVAAGEIPAQTNTIVGSPGDVAVPIHEDQTSDEVNGSAMNSFDQEKLQTENAVGRNATTMEADHPSLHNLSIVYKEEIPSEDTESKEQNSVILTSLMGQVCTIKEPTDLFGDDESCTEKHICADDTNDDHLFELGSSDCHMKIAGDVISQQEDDCTIVAAEHTIYKQEGQPCPDPDAVIRATRSATVPAVGAEVLSAGSSADLPNKDCSCDVTMENVIQDNASRTDGSTFMPHKIDSVELSSHSTSREINTAGSKDSVRQNQNIATDVNSHRMNEMHGLDVETKLWNEDISADTASHETNAARSADDFGGEQRKNEDIIAEASSHKISVVQGATDIEENEQIEEVIPKPACEQINVMSSEDIIREKKQSEVHVETNLACNIEHVEKKKPDEEVAADPVCEIDMMNIPSNIELKKRNEKTTNDPASCEISIGNITDNVEEQKQKDEITTDPTPCSLNVIPASDDEDKKLSEDMTEEGPRSLDVAMERGTNNVTEKYGDYMPGPTSCEVHAESTTQEKMQNEEITVGPASQGINVLHTAGDAEEKKNEDHTSDPTSGKIDAKSNTDDVKDKIQTEEITTDSNSHENNIPQGTDNAGDKEQEEEAVAHPSPDKLTTAQSIDNAEEHKQKEDTATKDDHTEEIADKEMTVNSDKNSVSLKSLLSQRGAGAREKNASSKDRAPSPSLRHRGSSKDSVSATRTKLDPGQQDWSSPARLPVEKPPKGKKQQWMPFICCPSIK